MQEIFDNAIAFLRAVLRFRWTALLVVWIVAAIGWSFVYLIDDVYKAEAKVFVDSNRILQPLLKGLAVQPDVNERIALMSRTLLNRPNLQKLVRMSDLDIETTTDFEKEKQLDELGRTVRLNGTRGNASLYSVSYENENPKIARRVVQSLITIFIESTIGDERKDSAAAQVFLDSQIRAYEQRLASAERRLSDFKRENAGKMPGESGGYYQRLEVAQTRERATRLELREAISRRERLRQQLENESPTLSEGGPNALSPLELQLIAQRDELSSLKVRFTDRHPRISQLQERISSLEQRVANQAADVANGGGRSQGIQIASPAYREVRALLADADARVAELEVRVEAFADDVVYLDETIETIPKIEARLQQLDRDYAVVKEQYATLLERRESARLSEQVEQNVDDVKFRVIDPPFVPSRPSGPNKLLFTAAVLAAAGGAGAAFAFLLSLIRPVFYDADAISKKTGRPVYGTVSKQGPLLGSRFWKMMSWTVWSGLLAIVFVVFLLLAAIHTHRVDVTNLQPLLESKAGPVIQFAGDALKNVVDMLRPLLGKVLGGA